MPSKSPNEPGYDGRLQFVENLFNEDLKIAALKVEVIAYDEVFPFPYNNFVFVVTAKSPVDAVGKEGKQPGTVPFPPLGHQKFVVRLPNLQATYNHRIRVENEVAALHLARQALQASFPNIIPRVFAWESAAGGKQGWMVQEYMPGASLSDDFPRMKLDNQRQILGQMADILKAFQEYKIPSSVRGYGGLSFDSAGEVVIGPLSIMEYGPFDTYDDLVLGTIRSKLADADKNKVVKGWTENDKDVRSRLEDFLRSGLNKLMGDFDEVQTQRLVHADFSTDNLLYDPSTMQITGLLDFDFGHIGTVADEFFRSLGHGIGRFPNVRDDDQMLPLNRAMLHGFPSPLPGITEHIEWPQAKMWDDALRERGMYRPGNILGIEALSSCFWLSAQILPFKLAWDFIIENSDSDVVQRWKTSGEQRLDEFLKEQGF